MGERRGGRETLQEQTIRMTLGVMNTITSVPSTVSVQCLRLRNVILSQTRTLRRGVRVPGPQNDSSSASMSPPTPKTNSCNNMSARRTSKASFNRNASSALVAISSDAASHLACKDRLILRAVTESLPHCDGSSISGGRISNWLVPSRPAFSKGKKKQRSEKEMPRFGWGHDAYSRDNISIQGRGESGGGRVLPHRRKGQSV